MAYCTQADVEIAVGGPVKLVQVADQVGAGSMDAAAIAVVAKAIKDADSAINSYIGHRYSVPLSPVPDSVAAMSAAWAARLLRRNLYNGQAMEVDHDQEVEDRKWLADVGKGIISLGIEPTPAKASMVIDKAGARDPSLKVSALRLRGYA